MTLPQMTEEARVDLWWNVVRKTQRYPALCKLALSALCPFHGPQVESAFSVMSNILQAKAANLSVETYESYQVVKYNLKAMQVSAIQHYSRKTKESPVNVQLCRNVKRSSQRYRALLRDKEELNKRPYHSEKPTAGKKMAKDAIVAAAVSARRKFQKKRVEALKKLATKAKESYKN